MNLVVVVVLGKEAIAPTKQRPGIYTPARFAQVCFRTSPHLTCRVVSFPAESERPFKPATVLSKARVEHSLFIHALVLYLTRNPELGKVCAVCASRRFRLPFGIESVEFPKLAIDYHNTHKHLLTARSTWTLTTRTSNFITKIETGETVAIPRQTRAYGIFTGAQRRNVFPVAAPGC
jgi:hypothetical protein